MAPFNIVASFAYIYSAATEEQRGKAISLSIRRHSRPVVFRGAPFYFQFGSRSSVGLTLHAFDSVSLYRSLAVPFTFFPVVSFPPIFGYLFLTYSQSFFNSTILLDACVSELSAAFDYYNIFCFDGMDTKC